MLLHGCPFSVSAFSRARRSAAPSFNLRILSKWCSLPALFLCPLDLVCASHSLPSSIIIGRKGSSVHISHTRLRRTVNNSEGLERRPSQRESPLREGFRDIQEE